MTEVRKTLTEYVADELRAESARRSITQESIAHAIGRAQSYVSKRWYDVATLTVDEYAKWCLALRVDPVEVMRRAELALRAEQVGVALTAEGWGVFVSEPAPEIIEPSPLAGTVDREPDFTLPNGTVVQVKDPVSPSPIVSASQDDLALVADGGHDLPPGSENGEGFDD